MRVRTRQPSPRRVTHVDTLVLEREAPDVLRACLHRLLRCRHRDITDDEKRVAELDEILDQLEAEPRCRLACVFEAYEKAATTAVVQQSRAEARKDVREVIKEDKAFWERLKRNLHTLQRLLANRDRPCPTNLAMRVQRLREALRELRPYATSLDHPPSVDPPRRPKRGRPEKQIWQEPLHNALQKVGLPIHYERRLTRLFNL